MKVKISSLDSLLNLCERVPAYDLRILPPTSDCVGTGRLELTLVVDTADPQCLRFPHSRWEVSLRTAELDPALSSSPI